MIFDWKTFCTFLGGMESMIHTLNKVTLRNQHKVPRKIKTRRTTLASKRSLKQDRPERKLNESWLKKTHYSMLAIIIFSLTFYLSSFFPLSSLSSPSIPLKTLHELNILASKVTGIMEEETVRTDEIEQLLVRKYKGVRNLSFLRTEKYKVNDTFPEKNSSEYLSQIGKKVSFQIPVGKDGTQGILVASQDISPFAKKTQKTE